MKDSNRKAYVYALRDPESLVVHYVGQTVAPYERFKSHISASGLDDHPRHVWIDSLVSQGRKPEMILLETTTVETIDQVENKWITYGLAQQWPLTNVRISEASNEVPVISDEYATPAPTNASYTTIKIYEKTHRKLRILAANSSETILELIDRLTREEKKRLENK